RSRTYKGRWASETRVPDGEDSRIRTRTRALRGQQGLGRGHSWPWHSDQELHEHPLSRRSATRPVRGYWRRITLSKHAASTGASQRVVVGGISDECQQRQSEFRWQRWLEQAQQQPE